MLSISELCFWLHLITLSDDNAFGEILEEVTADRGFCSEKNLLYLKDHKITSYIKLQDHEKRKTHAYTEEIGKYYNMNKQNCLFYFF